MKQSSQNKHRSTQNTHKLKIKSKPDRRRGWENQRRRPETKSSGV